MSTRLSTAPEPSPEALTIDLVAVALATPLRQTFDYLADPAQVETLRSGMRVRVPFGRRNVVGMVFGEPRKAVPQGHQYRAIGEVIDTEPLLDAGLLELCGWIASYYHHAPGEVLAAAIPSRLRSGQPAKLPVAENVSLTTAGSVAMEGLPSRATAMRRLLQTLQMQARPRSEIEVNSATLKRAMGHGWIEIGLAAIHMPSPRSDSFDQSLEPPLPLTAEQAVAHAALRETSSGFSINLLDGVTGSGKTEIYLQTTADALERGQQVLVLTPEIGLTPQLVERYTRRFGNRVACYHSGLSETERARTWLRVRAGQLDVLIGTRSAVFAPFPKLGLIVVDEEHDSSYKQQEGLRYSARDVALVRAQRLDIPVILGSATPALETLHNAQAGRYRHLHLNHRARGAPAPRIDIIDMRAQPLMSGLSPPLLDAVDAELQRGRQALLFINRRGYAPTLLCHACGWTAPCPHCDARMVLHRRRGRLQCHHCGSIAPVPDKCPDCGAKPLHAMGEGTERIEDALRLRFPDKRVERFDSDRLARAGEIERLSLAAHAGEIDLLVGTQVLAKGHDFAGLGLAGIVDADQALFGTDFRALERMGQLLTQVAGRVGRAGLPGRVLLQTHHPQNPLLRLLIDQGYAPFCKAVLEERRLHGLPPFAHLAMIRAQARDESAALSFLRRSRDALAPMADVELLGPAPASMSRRAGVYRAQLLLRSRSRAALHRVVEDWLAVVYSMRAGGGLRWSVDIDPADVF